MLTLQKLTILNNSTEGFLNKKDFQNPQIKLNLKQKKIGIYSNPNFQHESQAYLSQAIRFSQLNLLYALASRNSKQYENAINNVKFFYENTFANYQHHSKITAIHLLFLLSSNKTQEFFTKLQSIPYQGLKDTYISYVILLNDAIQEGNYRKVFSLRNQNPLPEYFGPFLDRILETIRTEIAKSSQRAYAEISLKEALNIFQFKSTEQLRNFVNSYHESLQQIQINWLIGEEKIVFQRQTNKKINFNSEEMINKMLEYSVELERIA